MIAHVSMPADDCATVARVLAFMLGGGALRFPPGGPDAFNVWPKGNDFQIVVTPRGHAVVEGREGQTWSVRARNDDRAAESHFAVAVERPANEILALAADAGWPARITRREGFFAVVEVWVEGAYLVEMLDPAQMADYRRTMTVDHWADVFAGRET